MDQPAEHEPTHDIDPLQARRTAWQVRHAQALSALMTEREDLRGVHALADLVADSLRWSA
jgi:hypothetical protein